MPVQTGASRPALGLFGGINRAMRDSIMPRMANMGRRALPMAINAGREGVEFARAYPGTVAALLEGMTTTGKTVAGMADRAGREAYEDFAYAGREDLRPDMGDAQRLIEMREGRPARLRAMAEREEARSGPMMERLVEADRRLRDRGTLEYIWSNYLQQPGVEGGGVVHETEGDPGGVTNWGVAQNYNRDVDVTRLTEKDAFDIAHQRYWTPYGLSSVAKEDPLKAVALLDGYYNIGSGNMEDILKASGGTTEGILREMRRYREAHPRHGLPRYGGNSAYVNRQRILEEFIRREKLRPEHQRLGGSRYARLDTDR